jgi:hypothetical protein
MLYDVETNLHSERWSHATVGHVCSDAVQILTTQKEIDMQLEKLYKVYHDALIVRSKTWSWPKLSQIPMYCYCFSNITTSVMFYCKKLKRLNKMSRLISNNINLHAPFIPMLIDINRISICQSVESQF